MDEMIGLRIRQRRKELNITQTQIQEQTSISSGNLSCIENGKYLPSAVALMELSKILCCSIDWMLTGESSISNTDQFSDIKEKELISAFRELSEDDQDEIMDIIQVKLSRAKRKKDQPARSSSSEGSESDILVG